jgi:hypothetical protein
MLWLTAPKCKLQQRKFCSIFSLLSCRLIFEYLLVTNTLVYFTLLHHNRCKYWYSYYQSQGYELFYHCATRTQPKHSSLLHFSVSFGRKRFWHECAALKCNKLVCFGCTLVALSWKTKLECLWQIISLERVNEAQPKHSSPLHSSINFVTNYGSVVLNCNKLCSFSTVVEHSTHNP